MWFFVFVQLLKIEILRLGKMGYSSLLHKIIFGGFNGKFKNTKILCVGDIILDSYVYGDVERISPEAPIPILKPDLVCLVLEYCPHNEIAEIYQTRTTRQYEQRYFER